MNLKVRKAVIPVAGYGTRFLPFTKAVPKPMLPILNKPALQIISEEVVNSGITDILFIVGYKKEILESHFDAAPELEKMLATTQENPHHCFDVGHHSLAAISHINDLGEQAGFRTKERVMLAYAALLHDVAKPDCKQVDDEGIAHFYKHPEYGAKKARGILRRLKFDNETVATVTTLIRYHDRRHENCVLSDEPQPRKAKQAMRRLMNQAGTDLMPLLFVLQQADLLSQSEYKQKEKLMRLEAAKRCYREICEAGEAVCVKDLAIGGRELIQMGMTPGPAIGEMLQQLLEHVLAHPEDNEKEKLLFLAKEWKK